MPGRCSHLVAFCLAVTAAWSGLACAGRAAAAPPNVVVILADDLGFSDLGCYGGEIDTPHLDRLAAGGLRFTQGYNTARCWPTRAALLTGYYAQAVNRDALPGGKGGTGGRRPAWAQLLPELLAPAGYRSYHSGKWHIDGDPRQQGFVRSLQVEGGQNDYFDPEGVTVEGTPIEANADYYVTTAIGGHAVECLQDHAAEHAGVPFFSYVAFTSPHFPLQAPQDVVEAYKDRYRAGWDAARAARFERLTAGNIVTSPLAPLEPQVGPPYQPKPDVLARFGPGEIDRPLPWASLTPQQREFQATKMAIHAAMVEIMDRAVGRIIGQLEAMNALDDTLILFLSDNGASAEILIRGKGHDPALPLGSAGTFPCLGPGWSSCANAPFRRHKTWVHEGGIATPWIVHWPKGIATKNALRTQPLHVIDVVPTVLELAGVAPPREHAGRPVPPMQGRSFAACLADPAAPPAHETLWWCHDGNRAVRVGDWKLVASKGDPWELYDLAGDRTETNNLAATQPERMAALERAWTAVSVECGRLAHVAELDREEPATQNAADTRPAAASAPARRPNIIYVMTDDQGYGDVAAHGNPVITTPNLDRMHRESVRLTEFHVSPTCAPTRAALMTGRHEFRSGVTHTIFERERLALSAVTLPQLLRSGGGYATGIFGKWHLGDEDAYQPGRRGFDRVFIHGGGGIGQSYPGSCGDAPGNTYFDPLIRSDGTFVKTKGYCTDVFFDAAIEWIDGQRKTEKPFFCYLTPNAPHDPLDCPSGSDTPYLAKLEAAGIADPKVREKIAKFYGMIGNIDANMGRLLAKLDEWGLAENTLVIFTTDNGTATGAQVFNAGMRGQKGTVYRGGTRVPALWRWRGTLPAGMDVPALTAHIDVLPTLCELTDVGLPPAVAEKAEGRSFAPLLRGARIAWPDRPLVTHLGRWDRGKAAESGYRQCRIREGQWSLVNTQNRPDAWELYDIASDPAEKHDVAAAQPDVVTRLAATYAAWWRSVQPDLVNENSDGPAENPFKAAYWKQFGPRPTLIDVPYGDHPKQKLHFWKSPQGEAGKPTPLLFFIHGGGWQGGNRMSGLTGLLAPVLEAGISVTSIEYRFIQDAMQQGVEPPVKAPLSDAARALQTVRSQAAEWGIDKERIVAAGGSAGACSSLWLAFHDDMADPASADPVARESTRLLAAAVTGAQTTLDPAQMKEWTPNSRYGGHAFGFMTRPDQRDSQFAQFLAAREKILPWIEAYSPYALVTPDDPPVALFYNTPPALGRDEKDPTHTANFGVKLVERLDAAGVPCELVYPGASSVQHATLHEAIIGFLKPAAESSRREPARRPNIVFFLCDDLGSGDLACTGSRDIQTPAIDALFARGTRLSRHWAGNAVCAPSRCVLLTGKHPGHAVIRSNREMKPEGQVPLPAGTVTLVQLLDDAGYATGGFGKWGLGGPGTHSDPIACGFDSFFGYNCQRQAHTYYPGHLWDDRSRVPLDGGRYAADLIAERQLAFIKAHADRPFFLYVPTTVPHLALQVPADEPSLADYERHFGAEAPYLGGKGYVPCPRPLATYAAMITRMDREVGRIVKELDDLGLTDDTIFVFSSDNGATAPGWGGIDTARLASNGPLRDWKGSPYEGGLRVPTVAVWPGHIPAGRVIDAPTGFEDWLPTLLDLAGLHDRIPADTDGVSLAAALAGKGPPPRDRVLYRELTERQWQTALDAHGRWKAVRKAVGKARPDQASPTELYDLSADPGETTNVAAGHPDVVARMEAILTREHVPHPDWPLAFADRPAPQDSAAARARRPNILFIIVDDQSPFDLPCYNPASTLHAPAIDRLAREGMVLDAAYHMGSFSGAVCTPSRHMVMCGRSVWHLPIGPSMAGNKLEGRADAVPTARCPPDIARFTLAPVLDRAGYDTMRTCKQGNAYEAADALFTVRHDATKREGTHAGGSAWHADRVLDYLAERKRTHDTDPFLIYFGFSHPHDTRDGTPELLARYGATNHADPATLPPADPRQPPLPPNWLPRHPFDHGHMDVRDEVAVSGVWKHRDERTIRNELGREYACSENIDRQIGRVLEKLTAMGELDNTWIVYTSDHGMAIGRHGLQGKQNLYEHTWRVPFIVRGPGVKPGSRAPGHVYLGDTLATLCDICGITPPASNEGTSFLPVLTGTRQTIRDVLYGVYCGGQKPGIRSVRKGDWKLVKYESPSGGRHTQLFNLKENPHELLAEHHDPAVTDLSHAAPPAGQQNLADDPAFAATRAEMEALLLAEMRRHDDPFRFSDQPPLEVAP
jgi:choline-sulfatase